MHDDPVKFAFLKALDEHAEELAEPARRERVAALLGAHATPERVADVLSLLDAHRTSGDFLDSSAMNDAGIAVPGKFISDHDAFAPGTRLGAFVIEAPLGVGGMGLVFRARQESPSRPVAIKVMRTPFDSRSMTRRFTREAAALARLQHPGIAQVYSAGVDSVAGRAVPYLAMELAEGSSLDAYLREVRPSVRVRAELIARVAEAVAHAHQRGVIHRDLKPANIIVGAEGTPKVLDFGIARLMEREGDSASSSSLPAPETQTSSTMRGEILGTLAYMAPEQFEGDPERIDLRADVYALGVLLYQTLAGQTPIAMDNLSIAAAAHAAATREPAALGMIDPALRGDLETIAAKALEKDPAHRYQSASELVEDLRRHLRDEPILARSATTLYRIRKFVRRNRAVSVLGVLVFVALAGGLATTLWQARIARAQAMATNETNVFLKDILLSVSPSQARGQVVTMRMALDQASEKLDAGAVTDQRVLASLHGVLSQAYFELGVLDRAEAHMRRAIDVRRTLGGEESQDYLDGVGDLCTILHTAGNREEVLKLAPPALETARRTLEPDSETTIRILTAFAHSAAESDPALAGRLYAESLERNRRARGPEHDMTLIALNNTAIWHMGQGDYQQAEKVHRELLDIRLRKLGENHPDTVVSLRNVGSSLRGQERNADAVVYLKRAVDIGDVVRGRGHPGQLSARIELALALSQSGEVDSSVALLRDSLPLTLTQTQRPTHRTVAYRATISEIFAIDKRFTEAMEEAVATRDAAQEVFGADHEDAKRAAALIRDAAEGLGDFAAARRANETLRGLPEYQTRWEITPGTPDTAPPAAKPS
jgi:eukaryotic-like serine/threonine-protein kinase